MSIGIRVGLFLGSAALALTGCAASVDSAPEGPRREDTSATIEPIIGGELTTAFPEAALLDMRSLAGGNYACSAALIAPRVVMTAGHCVDGMASWEVSVGGVRASSTSGETLDWHENGATNVNPAHHDVGLVYLDQPIALSSYPTLATAPVADGTSLVDVGRIDNGTLTNAFYRAPVSVVAAASVGYPYDYLAVDVIEHGDSGGPVYLPATHTIAAINSGANTQVEVLARVDLVADWIAGRVAALSNGDAPSPGAATPPGPGAAPDAGASPAGNIKPPSGNLAKAGSCAAEVEPNDTPAAATRLSGATCAALATASDADWYVFDAGAGTTRVGLVPGGDAVLSVGYMTGDQSPTCSVVIPASAGRRAAAVTVYGASAAQPARICLSVTSPSGTPQRYSLTLGH
ncbi:MAG: trypsin-like serine protease [Myxococcales bacterium]|nr:trypsin-like serine protease [Myxococcales bacterium]